MPIPSASSCGGAAATRLRGLAFAEAVLRPLTLRSSQPRTPAHTRASARWQATCTPYSPTGQRVATGLAG
eukprot:6212405-Pleurochrysis_carterae.AAC.6